jgi:MYXO-CTERM domain-containing protein
MRAGILFLLMGWMHATIALADAVPPPEKLCPPGTVGATDHYGPHCRPAVCNTDTDCTNGQACVASSMCVKRVTYGSPRGDTFRAEALGACSRKGSCPEESTCESAKYCGASTSKKEPPKTNPPQGVGCSVSPGGDPLASLFGLLLFYLRRKKGK